MGREVYAPCAPLRPCAPLPYGSAAVMVAGHFIASLPIVVFQMKDAPPPYTDCNDDPNYTQSQCEIKCLTEYVIKMCKCRDIYMPGKIDI